MPEYPPLICGIDPGQSGGIAFIRIGKIVASKDDYPICAYKMPDTEADTADLLNEFRSNIVMTFIEAVHSMPKQGVASSFKFGRSYGFLRGLLVGLKIPFEEVSPQKWQKGMNCLTHGDKNVSKAKAQHLFPYIRVTHALADALLIAEFCRRTRQ